MSSDAAQPIVPDSQIDDVLTRAADDWLWAASIYDAVGTHPVAGSEDGSEALTERAIALMRVLLRERLLRPGRIAFGRFLPWTCSTEDAIEHVAAHWRSLPYRLGTIDFFVWFDLTDRGLDRAERALAVEQAPSGCGAADGLVPPDDERAG